MSANLKNKLAEVLASADTFAAEADVLLAAKRRLALLREELTKEVAEITAEADAAQIAAAAVQNEIEAKQKKLAAVTAELEDAEVRLAKVVAKIEKAKA